MLIDTFVKVIHHCPHNHVFIGKESTRPYTNSAPQAKVWDFFFPGPILLPVLGMGQLGPLYKKINNVLTLLCMLLR
jgi:hypothetical protein